MMQYDVTGNATLCLLTIAFTYSRMHAHTHARITNAWLQNFQSNYMSFSPSPLLILQHMQNFPLSSFIPSSISLSLCLCLCLSPSHFLSLSLPPLSLSPSPPFSLSNYDLHNKVFNIKDACTLKANITN